MYAWGCGYAPSCISVELAIYCCGTVCIGIGVKNEKLIPAYMDWISKELLPTQTIQTSVVMMENTKCYYASKRFLWAQCIN